MKLPHSLQTPLKYLLTLLNALRSAALAGLAIFKFMIDLHVRGPVFYAILFSVAKFGTAWTSYKDRFDLFVSGEDPEIYYGAREYKKEKAILHKRSPFKDNQAFLHFWLVQYIKTHELHEDQIKNLCEQIGPSECDFDRIKTLCAENNYSVQKSILIQASSNSEDIKQPNNQEIKQRILTLKKQIQAIKVLTDEEIEKKSKNQATGLNIEITNEQDETTPKKEFELINLNDYFKPDVADSIFDPLNLCKTNLFYNLVFLKFQLRQLKKKIRNENFQKASYFLFKLFSICTHIILTFSATYSAQVILSVAGITGWLGVAITLLLASGGLLGSIVLNDRNYEKYAYSLARAFTLDAKQSFMNFIKSPKKWIAFIMAFLSAFSGTVFGYIGLERYLYLIVEHLFISLKFSISPYLRPSVDVATILFCIGSGIGYFFYNYRSISSVLLKPGRHHHLLKAHTPWWKSGNKLLTFCIALSICSAAALNFYSVNIKFGFWAATIFGLATLFFNLATSNLDSDLLKHFTGTIPVMTLNGSVSSSNPNPSLNDSAPSTPHEDWEELGESSSYESLHTSDPQDFHK